MESDHEAVQKEAIAGKIRNQEYTSARTLLLATIKTNPRLVNALEMLSVLEVLCATEKMLPGRGVDWYKVLQVLPIDDIATIEAQYRNIVDQLEPVKDNLPGANLALDFTKDAYSVLSDPVKRAAFDSKEHRSAEVLQNSDADAMKQRAADTSSNSHVEMQCGANLPRKEESIKEVPTASCVDRPTPFDSKLMVDILNNIDTTTNGTTDIANNSVSYIQQNGNLCLGSEGSLKKVMEGNCSNTPTSSKTKRTDTCFFGDNGDLELLADNHVDKKQKSICAKDGNCVSAQVDLDNRFAAPSHVKDDSCSSVKQYDYYDFENNRTMGHFASGQVWAAYDWEKMPRRYARINKIMTDKMQLQVSWYRPSPQSHQEKRWSDASLPFVCGTFIAEESKFSLIGPTMFSHQVSNDMPKQHLEVYPKKGEVWAIYSDWDIGWCVDPGMRKKSAFLIVEVLTSYLEDSGCMVAHLVKVDGFRSVFQRYLNSGSVLSLQIPIENLLMFSHRIPSFRFVGEEMYGVLEGMLELEPFAVPENLGHQFTFASVAPLSPVPALSNDANGIHESTFAQFSNPSTSKADSGSSQPGMLNSMNKLSPKDFVEEQIWAVYDARDRMPRSYVKVIHVVSSTKVCVSKLEPHPMLDEEIRWVEEGLPVACGIFRAGRETTLLDMSEFSHPVECDWSAKRSFYRIFPKKGEIWAIYKNWKINLNSFDLDRCEPRMVEILSDYSDENGVNACGLTAVKGCLTFFQRQLHEDFHLTRWIARSEMLSFSHRVPAFIVVEIKERDIPKGSWHLEPTALPPRIIN